MYAACTSSTAALQRVLHSLQQQQSLHRLEWYGTARGQRLGYPGTRQPSWALVSKRNGLMLLACILDFAPSRVLLERNWSSLRPCLQARFETILALGLTWSELQSLARPQHLHTRPIYQLGSHGKHRNQYSPWALLGWWHMPVGSLIACLLAVASACLALTN